MTDICNQWACILSLVFALLQVAFPRSITLHTEPVTLGKVVNFGLVTIGVVDFRTPITANHIPTVLTDETIHVMMILSAFPVTDVRIDLGSGLAPTDASSEKTFTLLLPRTVVLTHTIHACHTVRFPHTPRASPTSNAAASSQSLAINTLKCIVV